MIELRQVSHLYPSQEPAPPALREVSLTLHPGETVALLGETGAGKSTLAQVMAGLLTPTSGEALWDGVPAARALRGRGAPGRSRRLPVGYLFQHPEHQLFEATVGDDVAFGPRNLGLPAPQVDRRVRDALEAVGLAPERVGARSPFALSGGEQRRVALAGLLAVEPEILILDEPAAGLDPAGAEALLALLGRLHEQGTGLVVITHQLEEVAGLARRILVLHQGVLEVDAPLDEALKEPSRLAELGVEPPVPARVAARLLRRGVPISPERDLDGLVQAVERLLQEDRR